MWFSVKFLDIIKRAIGEKGQVVIHKDIRQILGLRARNNVIFEIENNKVILKSEQSPEEIVKDFFNTPKLKKRLTSKEIKKVIMEQYENEITGR